MLNVHIFSVNLLEHYLFGTSTTSWLINSVICFALVYWVIWPLGLVPLLDWLDYRAQKKAKMTTLELTPPSINDKINFASEELLRIVHNFYATQPLKDQITRRRQVVSCELVSTRAQGIRYLVKVPQFSAKSFERFISSYLPELNFKQVQSIPLSFKDSRASFVKFKQH